MEPRLIALKLVLAEFGIDEITPENEEAAQRAIYLAQFAGVKLGYMYGWYGRRRAFEALPERGDGEAGC